MLKKQKTTPINLFFNRYCKSKYYNLFSNRFLEKSIYLVLIIL